MKRMIGLVLILGGGALMLVGITNAGRELQTLYSDTSEHPLDASQDDGSQVSQSMLKDVSVGLCGAPLFMTGIVLFKLGRPRNHPL